MADVFLSYKRENLGEVQRIVRALRNAGLNVWWDQDITPDAPWEATIEQELERAKVVVVAWSKAAVASENVKAEARRARTQGKLVQVFVEACEPPLFFGERQGVDLTTWDGDGSDSRFQTLAAAATAIRAGKAPPRGVGYQRRRRRFWPVLAVAALGAISVVALDLAGSRVALCSAAPLQGVCAAIGAEDSAQTTAVPAPVFVAPTPGQDPSNAEQVEAPALQAPISRRLVVQSGQAFDVEFGQAADNVTDASDFILGGDVAGFSIQPIGANAAIGLTVMGRPTPAACGSEPARPTITWSIPMANDIGEYQCFVTTDGREGALVLRRQDARGVEIEIEVWR